METKSYHQASSQGTVLAACLLFANLDYSSLLQSTATAFVAGCLWLGFRLTYNYLEGKQKKTKGDKKNKDSDF